LEAEDEGQAPDHDRRAQDQDARLAQRLAEEAQHVTVEDLRDHPRGEPGDLAERGDPILGDAEPGAPHYLMIEISGWVASSVCVKT
jgi:hypothetical protein